MLFQVPNSSATYQTWRITIRSMQKNGHETSSQKWKLVLEWFLMLSCLRSCPTLCDPMDCTARQALLSMGFSRHEYWSRGPCLAPGDLPDLGIEPVSLKPPALAGGFFTTSSTAPWWKKVQFTKEASVHSLQRYCHQPSKGLREGNCMTGNPLREATEGTLELEVSFMASSH